MDCSSSVAAPLNDLTTVISSVCYLGIQRHLGRRYIQTFYDGTGYWLPDNLTEACGKPVREGQFYNVSVVSVLFQRLCNIRVLFVCGSAGHEVVYRHFGRIGRADAVGVIWRPLQMRLTTERRFCAILIAGQLVQWQNVISSIVHTQSN